MPYDPRRELRLLRAYTLASTVLLFGVGLVGFRTLRHPHFDEIDVGRINVVEPDGTLRLTISNRARLPDPVIAGKAYPLRGGTGAGAAGLIFFNDEGNENGGLIYQGGRDSSGYHASAHLTFDQFDQDETVSLSYGDRSGRRQAGLTITDRPTVAIQPMAESLLAIRALPEGPERTRRMQRLRDLMAQRGEVPAMRLFAGRSAAGEAVVVLADPKGRARLRLRVDSLGEPAIELLDERGTVTERFPERVRR